MTMDTFIKDLSLNNNFLKEHICFLDIETTGLCKQNNHIFCIGMLFSNGEKLSSSQWIITSPEEELLLLTSFLTFISSYQLIVTYSGKNFDKPFLMARLTTYDLDTSILENIPLLDLKNLNLLKLLSNDKSLKRKQLEESIGFMREVETSGKDLIKLYSIYKTTKASSYQNVLLTHNREELIGCYYFYEVYYLFSQLSYDKMSKVAESEHAICLRLQLPYPFNTQCKVVKDNTMLKWSRLDSHIEITLTAHDLVLRKYLTPAKDYVYIPSQEQIMHKSIAQFIPKELKQKVTKEDCYVQKQSIFLKLSKETLSTRDLWHDENKNVFIELTDSLTLEEVWKYIKYTISPRIS